MAALHQPDVPELPAWVYLSPRSAVHAIKQDLEARGLFRRLTARPYNWHAPDNCLWWLTPFTDWPAYAHGKIVVIPEGKRHFVGLHAEKGLGPVVLQVFPRVKSLCSGPGWVWPKVMRSFADGSFGSAIGAANAATGQPVRLELDATPVDYADSFEPYPDASRPSQDRLVWQAKGTSSGVTLDVVDSSLELGLLTGLARARSLADIARFFANEKDADWAWVDLYAGVPVLSGQALRSPAATTLDANAVFEQMVSPWLPWVS